MVDEFGPGFKGVALTAIEDALGSYFTAGSYEDQTIHVSIVRWLSWQQALGLLSIDANGAVSHAASAKALTSFNDLRITSRARKGRLIFKGEAPPAKVLNLLEEMLRGGYQVSPKDRNALYVLRSLRLIPSTAQPVLLDVPLVSHLDLWLAIKVSKQPAFREAFNLFFGQVSTVELGGVVAKFSNKELSDASKARYGASLAVWVNWVLDITGRVAAASSEQKPEHA